jgi:hypothetical protein
VVLLPWDLGDYADRVDRADDRRDQDAQLERLVEDRRATIDRCARIATLFESRALVAHLLERDPADIVPVTVNAVAPDDATVFASPRGHWEVFALC